MNPQLLTPLIDPELLTNLSLEELEALATCNLVTDTQIHLQELLEKNTEGKLSPQEIEELDFLLLKIDSLNLLKTRANYTLSRLK